MASVFNASWQLAKNRSKTMFKRTQWQKKIPLLAILAISPFFAACGEGDGDDDSSSSSASGGSTAGGALVCFALLLVSGNDECLSYIGSSSSSGSSGTIRFVSIDEYEPNNDWLNANIVVFPKSTDRDGFIIDGAVHDVLDQVDVFTFTRTFLRYHAFRLCADGQRFCTEFGEIDTLTAYIDILDQSGRVLASSQASDSNFLRLELAGGVPHYVRVVAGDTMATTVQYHLVGHEANY
jgi:hypothetical protein